MRTLFRPILVGSIGLAAIYLLFVACALRHRASPMVDDAAIVFRYVDLILAGQGIVYNPGGEHVYGSSSLPYTFALAMLGAVGMRLETAALTVNLIALAAAIALLYSLCVRRSGPDDAGAPLPPLLALIPCALALFHGTSLVWITQGLESGFHLLLCVAAVWCYDRRRHVLCGLWLALAVMNKLDAVAVAGALCVAHGWRRRRLPLRLGLVALAAYLPWLVFTWWYFGSALPMSLQAKQLGEFASAGHPVVVHYANHPYLLALALGSVVLVRRPFVLALSAWLVGYVVLYDLVARGKPFPWYFFPSDLVLYFLAGLTLARLLALSWRLGGLWTSGDSPAPSRFSAALRHAPRIATVALALAVLAFAWDTLNVARAQLRFTRHWSAAIEADRVDIGHWLKRYAGPGESVYTGHGWIQYLSGLHVYDFSGLNDPELVRLRRAGQEGEYLVRHRPHYLVNHDFVPPPALQDDYVLLARFTRTSKSTRWPDWSLWGRRDSVALRRLEGRTLPLVFP